MSDSGGTNFHSPPSTLYSAFSIEVAASRAVKLSGNPPLIFPEGGPAWSSSITGGVLSISNRSLSFSAVSARRESFEAASLATTFK